MTESIETEEEMQARVLKLVLYSLERHCNNYFNPTNDPNSTERNYPEAFLDLAKRIVHYETYVGKSAVDVAVNDLYKPSVVKDVSDMSWQKVYARELAIFKRIKVI